MVAALKAVRPQPLLEPPPAVVGWGRLRPEEERVVRESLKVMYPFTFDNLRLHYFMHKLGVGEPLSEEDRRTTEFELDDKRAEGNGWRMAEMHEMMREVGIGKPLTEEDRRLMADAKKQYSDGSNMWGHVKTGMLMRSLGLSQSVEDSERGFTLKLIDEARKTRDGHGLSRALHASYDVGLNSPPTEADLGVIGGAIEAYMSSAIGLPIAEVRYHMGEIESAMRKMGGPAAPMPPLKRFSR